MVEIFSIGYENYTPESFFARLKREGVERLIDVRNVAASRKPGFSKKALAAGCEENGIRYIHLQKLGNPKAIRDRIKRGNLAVEAWKAAYAEYLATAPEELENLAALIREKKSCLMCLEHSHTLCHREVTIESLQKMIPGLRITYLE